MAADRLLPPIVARIRPSRFAMAHRGLCKAGGFENFEYSPMNGRQTGALNLLGSVNKV